MFAIFTAIVELLKLGGGAVSKWAERRDQISGAKLEADLAKYKAQAELAAWKLKSDVEWDMEFAKAANSSWKDELILILWTIPLVGVFIPGLRPYVMEGFEYLKSWHPQFPELYAAGWSLILGATFAYKSFVKWTLPKSMATIAGAMGELPDDIPDAAVKAVTGR